MQLIWKIFSRFLSFNFQNFRHTDVISVMPKVEDDGASESSRESESEIDEPIRTQSPLPHDMNDQRIVDYTLNSVSTLVHGIKAKLKN